MKFNIIVVLFFLIINFTPFSTAQASRCDNIKEQISELRNLKSNYSITDEETLDTIQEAIDAAIEIHSYFDCGMLVLASTTALDKEDSPRGLEIAPTKEIMCSKLKSAFNLINELYSDSKSFLNVSVDADKECENAKDYVENVCEAKNELDASYTSLCTNDVAIMELCLASCKEHVQFKINKFRFFDSK